MKKISVLHRILRNSKHLLTTICFLVLTFTTSAATKISISNGNWSNASNWSPSGAPGVGDKVYIYHVINLDINFTPSDTIFVCGVLNFASGKVLTLNTGMLVLVNNANFNGRIGTMAVNSNISGNYIFQKWVTRCDGYSTYGTPFDTQISALNWYYCYRCMPSWSNIYCYNESVSGNMQNGYTDSIGGLVKRGKGFFYWYSNYSGGRNFPRQASLKGSTNFASTFNYSVSYTNSGSSSNDGYNFVANPFPGTIDWLSSNWTKNSIDAAIYTWNGCSGVYASYVNGIGVNGGSRYIPSLQGFWVKANGTNPNLRVPATAMVNVSQNLQRQSANSETLDHLLRVSLGDDEVAIHFDPNSTTGLDSLTDALKIYSDATTISCGVSSDSLDYSINSLPLGEHSIPVKVKKGGILRVSGTGSFPEYTVFLKDLLTGMSHPMGEDFEYKFSDTSLVSFNKRFEISFNQHVVTGTGAQTASKNVDVLIKPGIDSFTAVPQGFLYPVSISAFDFCGKQLFHVTLEEPEIELPKWNHPVILKVSDQFSCVVKKVL